MAYGGRQKRDDSTEITIGEEEILERASELVNSGSYDKIIDIQSAIRSKREEKLKALKSRVIKYSSDDKFSKINADLEKIDVILEDNSSLSESNIQEAQKLYNDLKQEFLALGDCEESFKLQKKMLNTYKNLNLKKKTRVCVKEKEDYHITTDKLFARAQELIELNDLDNASKVYDELRVVYADLPENSSKKDILHEKMNKIYSELIDNMQKPSSKDFEKQKRAIQNLLVKADKHASRDRIKASKKHFQRISEAYAKLPLGFLQDKVEMQHQILGLYRSISLMIHDELMRDVKTNHKKVKCFTYLVQKSIENDQLSIANPGYNRLLELYAKIPKEYFDKNVDLKNSVVSLHKQILSHTIAARGLGENGARAALTQMFEKLSLVHGKIKDHDFSLHQDYMDIYGLYNILSKEHFAGNEKLYGHVYKLYEEIILLNDLAKVSELIKKNDSTHLKEELSKIDHKRIRLAKKYKEDIELFNFVRDRVRIYDNLSDDFDSVEAFQKNLVKIATQKDVDLLDSTLAYSYEKNAQSYLQEKYQ